MRAYIYGIAIIVLAAAAGSGVRANDDPAGRIIRSVGQRVAADPRLTVFEIHARTSGNGYVVFGKVEDLSVKEILLDTLRRELRVDAIDSITVLPDPVLGPDTLGIIRIPVADVRRTPGVRKELVSQALLGTDVKLLERVKGFYRVRMRDGYHGWISEKSLRVVDSAALAAWRDSRRVIVTDLYCTIRSKPDTASSTVCRAVLGSLLKYRGTRGGWTDVERPDSTRGYADNASVRDYRSWLAERSRTPASLEKTAVRFLGIPYLWGGTSVRGFDCSGFTQTVYRWSGRELLRDASEQATMGAAIDPGKDFRHLKKGDLVFFGRKADGKNPEHITHVGLSMGGTLFIHNAFRGKHVRYGSFDPASPYYDGKLRERFVRARRIL